MFFRKKKQAMGLDKASAALIAVCVTLIAAAAIVVAAYYSTDPWKIVKVVRRPVRLSMHRNAVTPQVLHLVLWSDVPHYNAMRDATYVYYKQFEPQVRTIYYRYDPALSAPLLEGHTLLLPGTECFKPCILIKTLQAFQATQHLPFDFLVRSNVSTVVNWSVLLELLKATPELHFGGGRVTRISPQYFGQTFVQGTGIVLSRATLQHLMRDAALFRADLQDDNSLSEAVRRVPWVKRTVYDLGKYYKVTSARYTPSVKDVQHYAFFRNKTTGNRWRDVTRMQALVSAL